MTFRSIEARALAARVPDEDLGGPGRELISVSGWYAQPTVSGRTAWTRFAWCDGTCHRRETTYDLGAEKAYMEAEFDATEREFLEEEALEQVESGEDLSEQ